MNSLNETDFGTPQRLGAASISVEIDGVAIDVAPGTSVMRAAVEAGINVPKLCATDSLEPFGSCRLCLVEIAGKKGYPASCTTPVEPGMKIKARVWQNCGAA
jgi:formate dehydrogenase major subunit